MGSARLGASCGSLAALACLALVAGPAPAAAPVAGISVRLTPAQMTIGAAASVTGTIAVGGAPAAGAPLALRADGYPFARYATIARQSSAADGTFSFTGLHLDRNTRLRVELESAPASASVPVVAIVDPSVALTARSLGPGRTRLTLRIRHTRAAGPARTSVAWFVAAAGSRLVHLAGSTPTREIAPGVSYASVIVDPPAARFVYRACLNPAWEHAMGAPAEHGRCPTHGYLARADGR